MVTLDLAGTSLEIMQLGPMKMRPSPIQTRPEMQEAEPIWTRLPIMGCRGSETGRH